ncbi:DUF427 domain-containing protein [Aldersonia kunmingensis]|uniref:DUF427 domain-containing protein n=1 Tax=Aldersonia kunmingensis TaxID=408066 RepID=UPI00082D8486|nr:DUF427 domain-containing protein [Aldersonia kunmingensis]
MSRTRLEPSAQHPITIEPTLGTVRVRAGTQVIATSDRAFTLSEANYPVVHYLPIDDVDRSILRASEHTTYCPFKGDASYYSLATADGELTNAVWVYQEPYPAVAEIAGCVAFYPDQVDIEVSASA